MSGDPVSSLWAVRGRDVPSRNSWLRPAGLRVEQAGIVSRTEGLVAASMTENTEYTLAKIRGSDTYLLTVK